MRQKRHSSRVRLVLIVTVVVAVLVAGIATFRTGPEAEITVLTELPGIGVGTPITVSAEASGRGLGPVTVDVVQGDRSATVLAADHAPPAALALWAHGTSRLERTVEVGSAAVEWLQTGDATIRVRVERPGTWLLRPQAAAKEVELEVDLVPPAIELRSSAGVARGGSDLVRYWVDDSAVRDGVEAGDAWFPGFTAPGQDVQQRFALYSAPFEIDDASEIRLVAEDLLGNRSELPFLGALRGGERPSDTIRLTDAFLRRKVPEILSRTPELPAGESPLDSYLRINRELRARNGEALKALAAQTREALLWDGGFEQLPRAKVMARFGDRRTYLYNGEVVDHQTHMGYDLASVRRAPVPAANDGVVVLADYLGIYGNSVVVDHGYGLMTLYSHLSELDVSVGEQVRTGQTLARTGATGLAGGDHLHFGVLIAGTPVDPLEWWDPAWITSHITSKLPIDPG
jgi:murein DD-endopeptidase MepM/ murein hydrolase activator NlpD